MGPETIEALGKVIPVPGPVPTVRELIAAAVVFGSVEVACEGPGEDIIAAVRSIGGNILL